MTTFPEPDRSNHQLRREKTWQKSVVDIGWAEGVMSDGRPYLMEAWTQDDTDGVTFYFSRFGIRVTSDDPWYEDLLEREGLVQFKTRGDTEATRVDDAAHQPMWAVAVILRRADQELATAIPYRLYPPPPSRQGPTRPPEPQPPNARWVYTENGLQRSDSSPRRQRRFAKPDYSDCRPRRTYEKDERTDVGWSEGVLADGRPFRMELCCCPPMVDATFYVSREGLDNRDDWGWEDFLVEQGLIRFTDRFRILSADEEEDDRDQPMWRISVLVGDDHGSVAHVMVPWRPYEPGADN